MKNGAAPAGKMIELQIELKHLKSDSKVNVLEVSKEYPNRGNSKFVRFMLQSN